MTSTTPTPAPAPTRTHVHEVLWLLETAHGLTARYCKRDTRVITIVADAAARRFADSNPTTRVFRYPNGRTVYSVDVAGDWVVRFDQFEAPAAQPSPIDIDALSLSELEAAMLAAPCGDQFDALVAALAAPCGDDARVVTGDDGLDHYL